MVFLLSEASRTLVFLSFVSLLTAVLIAVLPLFKYPSNDVRHLLLKTLCVGSSIFNFTIFLGQAYTATGLIDLGLTLFGWLGSLVYGILAIGFLIIAITVYMRPKLHVKDEIDGK